MVISDRFRRGSAHSSSGRATFTSFPSPKAEDELGSLGPVDDRLSVAGAALGSNSTSRVLLIRQRVSAHAPAGREEDEHGDDNQYHRRKELQIQHRCPYRSVVPFQTWVGHGEQLATEVPSG
ncbi:MULTISPECIES: hypothetical protein [Curtobacterium]|uniref:Uncharacterized protein n=4 Tax=Curtobacterium TaxID=2034 RepID=A0A8H9GB67_9MICO|nr:MULTISPECIES: hypothetical protein [Curtobacterium]MBM7802770.1 hypothetical protein [Curtobacterium luteum]NUU51238.1 hypothetical protein [Curtobacterium luteum]QKS12370.1 hypothetical protein HUN60_03855 [Curtobacterium sp. csp3]GGL12124.1 hypothetical protein GCM10009769_32640 [Curtobacterium luteum]